jgi:hypothetical protein
MAIQFVLGYQFDRALEKLRKFLCKRQTLRGDNRTAADMSTNIVNYRIALRSRNSRLKGEDPTNVQKFVFVHRQSSH